MKPKKNRMAYAVLDGREEKFPLYMKGKASLQTSRLVSICIKIDGEFHDLDPKSDEVAGYKIIVIYTDRSMFEPKNGKLVERHGHGVAKSIADRKKAAEMGDKFYVGLLCPKCLTKLKNVGWNTCRECNRQLKREQYLEKKEPERTEDYIEKHKNNIMYQKWG
jgi:hypothetical protein